MMELPATQALSRETFKRSPRGAITFYTISEPLEQRFTSHECTRIVYIPVAVQTFTLRTLS